MEGIYINIERGVSEKTWSIFLVLVAFVILMLPVGIRVSLNSLNVVLSTYISLVPAILVTSIEFKYLFVYLSSPCYLSIIGLHQFILPLVYKLLGNKMDESFIIQKGTYRTLSLQGDRVIWGTKKGIPEIFVLGCDVNKVFNILVKRLKESERKDTVLVYDMRRDNRSINLLLDRGNIIISGRSFQFREVHIDDLPFPVFMIMTMNRGIAMYTDSFVLDNDSKEIIRLLIKSYTISIKEDRYESFLYNKDEYLSIKVCTKHYLKLSLMSFNSGLIPKKLKYGPTSLDISHMYKRQETKGIIDVSLTRFTALVVMILNVKLSSSLSNEKLEDVSNASLSWLYLPFVYVFIILVFFVSYVDVPHRTGGRSLEEIFEGGEKKIVIGRTSRTNFLILLATVLLLGGLAGQYVYYKKGLPESLSTDTNWTAFCTCLVAEILLMVLYYLYFIFQMVTVRLSKVINYFLFILGFIDALFSYILLLLLCKTAD